MTEKATTPVRCAIYTRVSTDHGLQQDFNSLDAQYDASQAYIRSQAHAGWALLRTKYDDGGFSGGNTERPALQNLLDDIRAGRIDVIVVYKVDRLTRSLADFAKLVELFDKQNVSFVSVTQQFNTTTSMGRLTLNVLLSFAQFEREVTSERIRDKIAASKRKGLWVGGMTPIGYDTKDRKITVNNAEAETVRQIFRSYLRLASLNLLAEHLRKTGIVSKIRKRKDGQIVGGTCLTRGGLAYLLRNRFYVGEVTFKGEVLQGEQPAIIDRRLFDAVQTKLDQQLNSEKTTRQTSGALLIGRIYDDCGNRMSPTHTRKKGIRYRYYLSNVLVQGQTKKAGAVCRVPAAEVEAIISKSLRRFLKLTGPIDDRALIETHLARVVVESERLCLTLSAKKTSDGAATKRMKVIYVPWRKQPSKRKREILRSSASGNKRTRPIRSETRGVLIASIVRGRRWLDEVLRDSHITTAHIAAREKCSVRKVNMTMSLAFLAPTLVKAALEGRLPDGMGVARLSDMPAEWSRQYEALGLASP